ncbi:OLC1v1034401C1 [Oldenlandia corymbosa var. corymbosa]|uniref:OLC1v1034401C1 n=1 Tax=Oldenlandia corymbosa var. corymbosa TaxID=529605 RepID=A0AAV1CQM5_OLDCO|nr:OLC1v1034401C1 [Oldenlandia corymbosa var. corymbosa]
MANLVLIMIAASLLTAGSSRATVDFPKEDQEVFHACGKVLCQDCTEGWNEWVNGAKPIKGCKVSVTCLDDRSRVIYYGSDLTDEAGEFDMIVDKYINGKLVNAERCFLRLVSSPHPVCNIATDFAGGKSGVALGRPAIVFRNLVKYVLGPFYYTTPMCDEPDTTEAFLPPRPKPKPTTAAPHFSVMAVRSSRAVARITAVISSSPPWSASVPALQNSATSGQLSSSSVTAVLDHGVPMPRCASYSSSSSSSSTTNQKPRRKVDDRLSSVIDAVNDRKLPPELRGQRNNVRSETDIINVVEQRIYHSMEEGHFENLPGKGKPLNLSSNPHADPAEDTLYRILSKNGCAPEWVELNKEIRNNIAEWRKALQKACSYRDSQDEAKWTEYSEALKLQLRGINDKVFRYNLIVPFGRQIFGLKWEKELERLEEKI